MDSEELFHLTEESIQRIRRVRYAEFGILPEREQVREIAFQTVICGTDLLVRVVPVLPVALEGLLLEEIFPSREPFIEQYSEVFFRRERQCLPDSQQFLSGKELWF